MEPWSDGGIFAIMIGFMRKNRLSTLSLAVLVLGQLPLGAIAAGPCTVSALDTVAGLGTQVTISSCAGVGTTSLSLRGPSGTSSYTQQISLDAAGSAMTLIPSKYTFTAGRYDVTAAGTSTTFSVIADRADDGHSKFTASPVSIRSNGQDAVTVTAILRDKYDNPVAGRPIALISSRASDEVNALSAQTDENGRMLWTVRATESGPMTLIPYDIVSAKQLTLRADITVGGSSSVNSLRAALTSFGGEGDFTGDLTSSVIDHVELSLPQNVTEVKANELFSMNVKAMNGTSVVRGYVGTLIVESSDPDAELPKKGEDPKTPETGRIDMRSVDQGERKLSLIFVLRKRGAQTITVYDKLDPSVKGEITLNVTRDGGTDSEMITIKSPLDRARIKGTTVRLQGTAPSLVNLKVKGGLSTIDAETDAEGVFRIDVPLNPQDKEVTLFVTSENGTMESEPVHLIIDNEAPEISTVSIDPPEGKTEEPATLTVKSEADLTSVTAEFNDATLTLTGSGTAYSAQMTAPKDAGTYDIKVTATDSVGNASTMLTKWTVKPRQMPVVNGVKAESQPLQVSITWNEIDTVPVAEYKIYIADEQDPGNYLYSISTKKPVTSAVIKDLPLGKTYQFSLTAVNAEGQESTEKSEPATASPLGMSFTAKSGKDSLFLEWSELKDLPLDHYILEYGTEPGVYPEKRTIKGEARSFMLRDLLNDVTYELKLTPVAVTGKTMSDLAAVTRGTPSGTGFTPGVDDPVPPDIDDTLHPGANLPPPPPPYVPDVPTTPGSGIPSMVGALMVLAAVVGGFLWRGSMKQRKMTQEFLSTMQQRYHS